MQLVYSDLRKKLLTFRGDLPRIPRIPPDKSFLFRSIWRS